MTGDAPVIVPEETALTAPYWQAARHGELHLQRCASCVIALHPPQPCCPRCLSSAELSWSAASGFGVVYAITIVEHAAHPAVNQLLPYAVVLVRLDEGPLVISSTPIGPDGRHAEVGSRVRVAFKPVTGTDVLLPYFVGINSADLQPSNRARLLASASAP